MTTFTERYCAPLIWVAILAVGLIWLGLPIDIQPSWFIVLGIILLIGAGTVVFTVYGRWRAHRSGDEYRLKHVGELPIILIAGPYSSVLFARGQTLRRSHDAVWLLVKTPAEVESVMSAIRDAHQRFPDAVLVPVVADGCSEEAEMRRELVQWQRALGEGQRYHACMLPCYVAIYAALGEDDLSRPAWFGNLDISIAKPGAATASRFVRATRHQLDHAWLTLAQPWLVPRAALGHAVFDWLGDAALLPMLTSLANTAPFSLQGLLLADIGSASTYTGAWTRWLTGKTGLQPRVDTRPASTLPLPDVISAQVSSFGERGRRAPCRVASHVMAAVIVTLAISFCVSAWQNSRMVARVTRSLNAYWTTPAIRMSEKRDRFDALNGWNAELARYARVGAPTGLGWGFYRGDALRTAITTALANWRNQSVDVTINELSLFDSGKATLKPGALSKLQGVLGLIQRNPGERILIAGHTDNVGSRAANLKLSEARASAIRDWFVENAQVSATRFAIQGYGDTRPIASNESSQGRAVNRRVEIILTPEFGEPR